MRAIAKAVGVPTEEWFENAPADTMRAVLAEEEALATRVESLFGPSGTRAHVSPVRTRMWPA